MLTIPVVFWNCPACGKRFFHRWWAFDSDFKTMYNIFRRKCAHCGLPKWQEPAGKSDLNVPNDYSGSTQKASLRKSRETFLTLVLRDDPGAIGLKLDRNGWAAIDELLKRAKRCRIELLREELDEILSEAESSLFESGGSGTMIRFKRNA